MSVLRNIDLPILADDAQSDSRNQGNQSGDLRLGLIAALACWGVILALLLLV